MKLGSYTDAQRKFFVTEEDNVKLQYVATVKKANPQKNGIEQKGGLFSELKFKKGKKSNNLHAINWNKFKMNEKKILFGSMMN